MTRPDIQFHIEFYFSDCTATGCLNCDSDEAKCSTCPSGKYNDGTNCVGKLDRDLNAELILTFK